LLNIILFMEVNLIFIGFVLVIIGFLIIFLSSVSGVKTKWAIGGFIGFLPFGFSNDPQMLKWVITITAIIAVVFIVFLLKGIHV